MTGPVASWDWTLKADAELFDYEDLIKVLTTLGKKWVFQHEEGEDGYLHYQGRMSLFAKKRKSDLLKLLNECPKWAQVMSLRPTSSNGLKEGDWYMIKLDTRVDGPWKSTDKAIIEKIMKPVYIPRQVRETPDMRPWQQSIIDDKDVWNTRTINVVWDPKGGIGKSTLISHCRVKGYARVLPPMNCAVDMLRAVCNMPESTMYMFDMPRAMDKSKLYGFYQAIETIKDGYAYDDRYHFKEKHFDCPNIWIFTNKLPDEDMLSRDRWRIWRVCKDSKLLAFAPSSNLGASL